MLWCFDRDAARAPEVQIGFHMWAAIVSGGSVVGERDAVHERFKPHRLWRNLSTMSQQGAEGEVTANVFWELNINWTRRRGQEDGDLLVVHVDIEYEELLL